MSFKTTLGTVLCLTPFLLNCDPSTESQPVTNYRTSQQGYFQVEERAKEELNHLRELMICIYQKDFPQNDILTLSDLNNDHRVTLSEVERTLAEQSKKDNLRSNSECFVKKDTLLRYLQ